jgi:hypothetical protein
MIFESPLYSPEQRHLLDLATGAELDRGAVEKLFWLIDAHPRLLAFAQIAENLTAILDTAQLVGLGETSNPQWPSLIPAWLRFCRWLSNSQAKLLSEPQLANVFLRPKSRKKGTGAANKQVSHPLNDKGLSRHGVYASLWNRHESGGGRVAGGSHSAGYLALQAHLLIALATARETYTRLDEYLNYTGEKEFSMYPRSSYPASLAIRNLSRSELTPLLDHLTPGVPFETLVAHLTKITTDRTTVPGVDVDLAIEYPQLLLRLFGPIRDILRSGNTGISRGTRSRSAGVRVADRNSRHLPGYVNLTQHVVRYQLESVEDWAGSVDIVCLDETSDEERRLDELTGEAPSERERPILALYDPQELKGAMARARTAERIQTLVAQRFSWDLPQPTAEQLCRLREAVEVCWNAFLEKPDNARRRLEVQVALILETMLFLGKGVNAARELVLRSMSSASVREFALLLDKDAEGTPRLQGWRLPIIEPTYRTSLSAGQLKHARPRAQSFVVPDLSGLGRRILEYARICDRNPPDRVFTLHETTFHKVLDEMREDTPGLCDLTPLRLQRVLETTVFCRTGDWALAWLIGGDETRVGETRLYYAGYPLLTLQAAYRRSAGEMLGRVGAPPREAAMPLPDMPIQEYAGARFLAKPEAVRDLLARLRSGMKAFLPGGERTAEWIAYHNSFTLYSWLMQALMTGMRAINDPTEIIDQLGGNQGWPLTVTLADKETVFLDRARPARLPDMLRKQLAHYRAHAAHVVTALSIGRSLRDALGEGAPLFVLSERKKPVMLTRTWIEQQLDDLGYPLPANFARAFLRTELIARACPAESVDALLGHASAGERPFAVMASFDYARHFQAVDDAVLSVCRAIQLVPVSSRLLVR